MSIEIAQAFLGWSAVLNYGILIYWFGWIMLAGDWVYAMQIRFLRVDRPIFDAIHYAGISGFKVFIFAFNLVPYLALRIAAG